MAAGGYYTNANDEEYGINFESMLRYAKVITAQWWVIAIFAVSFALAGFTFSKITHEDKFSSHIIFNASNKSSDIAGEAAKYTTASDVQASIMFATSFKTILSDTEYIYTLVQKAVKTQTGQDYSAAHIRRSVSASVIPDTTMISVKISTADAEKSFQIAKALAAVYSQVMEDSFPNAKYTIVNQASLATNPDADFSSILYTFLGALGGAILAFAIILILNRIKNLIQSSDDVRKKFNLDVLASVSKLKSKKNKSGDKKALLITDKTVGLPFIETFKLIKTKIENASFKKGYKVFSITSATENEGKTTVSVNLALSLAKAGRSVLLIDCDIRKPAVFKALGVPVGEDRGIYDIVSGKSTFEEAVKYVEKYNLYLLVSGAAVADPSEVLASQVTEDIIKEAKKNFDFVIIDCPPAGVLADATIVANYCDAVLFVVAENKPSLREIEYAISDLSTTKADIFGCVYNIASRSIISNITRSSYFNKYYGAYYGQDLTQRKR
jgi:capsular exopolysaccharide synthesis family protein